jgi:hypothetical protein
MWVWTSIPPGITILLLASIVLSAGGSPDFFPMAAIFPSSMCISASVNPDSRNIFPFFIVMSCIGSPPSYPLQPAAA